MSSGVSKALPTTNFSTTFSVCLAIFSLVFDPIFPKNYAPFIDLQAFILTHTSLNACAHLSCVTFEGRKPYERQRGYSAWYNSVWYISLQSQYEWERNEAIARKGYVTNDLKVDTFHPHYLATIQACFKSPKSNKKGQAMQNAGAGFKVNATGLYSAHVSMQ